jgi:ketosteroid isomerase-like protein
MAMALHDELLALEHAAWKANLAGDGAHYDRYLTHDALSVSPFGVATRDEAVAVINANQNPYSSYELTEPHILALADDAALVTYRVRVEGDTDGSPFSYDAFATSVYVRRDDAWRGAFFQMTFPGSV